jgi:nucleotide-binding universal stress UspA family protein
METALIPSGAVVVGVDGSPSSERAVRWAAVQASLEHRPLVLAHGATLTVANTWVGAPSVDPAVIAEAVEESGRALLRHAAEIVRSQCPDVKLYEALERRDPRDALLGLSRHAALVVVGSRGRGTMASIVLGSASLTISQHAHCPVVVLRRDGGSRSDKHGAGILVGTDGTARSDAALGFAFRQASLRRMPLTVLHAYWTEQDEGFTSLAPSYPRADAEDMRLLVAESIAGLESDYPEVEVEIRIEHGLADKVVVHEARSADLVVVGTHPVNTVYDLLAGEVSRAVLGRATCAVAVVPDPDAGTQADEPDDT